MATITVTDVINAFNEAEPKHENFNSYLDYTLAMKDFYSNFTFRTFGRLEADNTLDAATKETFCKVWTGTIQAMAK
jgi:hypothetical protein